MKTALIVGLLIAPAVALADHPCKKIEAACEAAGFVKGGAKEGKGVFKNCLKPIIDGQTVNGVTVDPADAAACKAKIATHKSGDAPPPPPPAK
jgi:hypothetical protein